MTSKRVWAVLEDRWKGGFEGLLVEEQEAIAIWLLVSETMNGALDQFFWNSSGDLALLAQAGLQKLDQPITLAALNAALAYFGPEYPVERFKRQDALEAIVSQHGEEVFNASSDTIQDFPEDVEEAALSRLREVYARIGIGDPEDPHH